MTGAFARSPDGSWVANRPRALGELLTVRPDGTDLRRFEGTLPIGAGGPGLRGSRDGSAIAYVARRAPTAPLAPFAAGASGPLVPGGDVSGFEAP